MVRLDCSDPECTKSPSSRMISGARFGLPGQIHNTCYARRAALANARTGARQPKKHRMAFDVFKVPAWCPRGPDLDRLDPPAASAIIRRAWAKPWASVLFTAEPRGWREDVATREAPGG